MSIWKSRWQDGFLREPWWFELLLVPLWCFAIMCIGIKEYVQKELEIGAYRKVKR